ncbi:M-phase-specific PLK1-interacting protein-like [Acanthaster planci]|uniref:M-phase-specific PLK1-interacting protein-like n=1 Tax=Acanthaster planci TaxID=133434 RepID=A0A8B7XI06_ACAPL|nr:M-phase-specific PLK1-interacting protein-like [Acanthaster planci]
MNQKGNYHRSPYSGGVPGWGESPMHQRGPHPGGQPGYWGQRGPSPHGRSFEHRGPPGHTPRPRQSPRGQFPSPRVQFPSPMYSSSPYAQQTPHQQHRMGHRRGGAGSPRFPQFGGRNSGGGHFTPPRHSSLGQTNSSGTDGSGDDISEYYKHSMVEDPWKDLSPMPARTGTAT